MARGTIGERVDALLQERETRGLRVPVIARFVFALILVPSVLGLGRSDETQAEASTVFAVLIALWLIVNAYFYWNLRRGTHVGTIGVVGAALDGGFVLAQFFVGIAFMRDVGVPATAVFSSPTPYFVPLLTAINGLALRPRYPIICGVSGFLAMGVAFVSASGEGALVMGDPVAHFTGQRLGIAETFGAFTTIAAAVVVIVFITHAARRLVREASEQEVLNAELQRQHVETLMRGKMDALAKLVASVSHNLNSPLGVIKSGLETQTKVLGRLEPKADSERDEKLLGKAREILGTVVAAAERIDETTASLRSFVRLDQAEFQKFDVREEVSRLLEGTVVPEGKEITITRRFDEVPDVHGNPKEIGHALATILENAFDAIDDEGTVEVRISLDDGEVALSIADSGRGIPPDAIDGLFDVALRAAEGRVGASFGLAAAQSVAHRNGGRITVESHLGEGTTFTFHFPA